VTRAEEIADAIRGIGEPLDGDCVVVHRELGPAFTHHDSPACACSPTRIVVLPGDDVEAVAERIAREERESEA
jgi:hypothetical protein